MFEGVSGIMMFFVGRFGMGKREPNSSVGVGD